MSGESNVKKLAAILDGREIGDEVTNDIRSEAKFAGLVIVYGAGDDLIEFDGAFRDEAGCYSALDETPSEYMVDRDGLLSRGPDRTLTDDEIAAFVKRRDLAKSIRANWDVDGYSWTYTTDIPHETFDIMEDGEKYCRGIVFDLASIDRREGQSS